MLPGLTSAGVGTAGVRGCAEVAATAHNTQTRHIRKRFLISASLFLIPDPCALIPVYLPGVMRWAVDVPAFMIQTPPCLLSDGRPVDAVVAPGTAIVMCRRA